MSTLKAACADNFYQPPDWDPRRASRAEYNTGQQGWKVHPLRERARKLATEGVLVIRFEMPFDVRCTGCGCRIAKGVRFNAEKKCVGKYLSTKIWSFRFLCHAEDGTSRTDRSRNPHFIEVRTDPKEADYVVHEGAQKVAATEKGAAELGVESLLDPSSVSRAASDPFYAVEAKAEATRKRKLGQTLAPRIERLRQQRDERWADDYAVSQRLRAQHRAARKSDLLKQAMLDAKGIRLPLKAMEVAAAEVEEEGETEGGAGRQPGEHGGGGGGGAGDAVAVAAAAEAARARARPLDAAAAAAAPFGTRLRLSDAKCEERKLRLMAGSIFQASSQEDRLRALQTRKLRGMQVRTGPSPSLRVKAAHTRVGGHGGGGGSGGGGGCGSGGVRARLVHRGDRLGIAEDFVSVQALNHGWKGKYEVGEGSVVQSSAGVGEADSHGGFDGERVAGTVKSEVAPLEAASLKGHRQRGGAVGHALEGEGTAGGGGGGGGAGGAGDSAMASPVSSAVANAVAEVLQRRLESSQSEANDHMRWPAQCERRESSLGPGGSPEQEAQLSFEAIPRRASEAGADGGLVRRPRGSLKLGMDGDWNGWCHGGVEVPSEAVAHVGSRSGIEAEREGFSALALVGYSDSDSGA